MIGNTPTFSVTEFVAVFNQSLEMVFPLVSVTGEVANFRVSKGKWVYFDLKDEHSSVKFFGSTFSLPGPLEDGMSVEVIGRPRLHQQFGFSVNYDRIRPVGEGSIKKAQNLLAQKLEREGLFSSDRKRSVPYPPSRIGLITSAESAAIADFKKIIKARWPALKIQLVDTLVQGSSAPASIVGAINTFNLQSDPPELLVIIRGGGSADDLAAFSEESVVRAVAASRIPTVVAIGHESDVSLAELAADVHASTPSNAAELLVPDTAHEKQLVERHQESLVNLMKRQLDDAKTDAKSYRETFKNELDVVLVNLRNHLNNQKILLKALDPLLPLEQGYALLRNSDGKHIKRLSQIKAGEVFSMELTDGKKQAKLLTDE